MWYPPAILTHRVTLLPNGESAMVSATACPRTKRSNQLIAALEPFSRAVVVMHDNPDPDAIATGWAIKFLLEKCTDKPVRLIGGGDIIRAENRQMVKLLGPP